MQWARTSSPPRHGINISHNSAYLSRLILIGELDVTTSPVFREELAGAHGPVIVDCQNLTFADSTGISELIQVANRVESFTLVNAQIAVRRVVTLLGSEVLQVED